MGEEKIKIQTYKLPNDINLNDIVNFEYFDKAVRENSMHAYDAMRYAVEDIGITRTKYNQCYSEKKAREIKNVIFSDKYTIVLWEDGTKTMVKCEDENFDREKGLAMAIVKKFLGTNKNKSNYYDVFKKWIPEHSLNEEVTISFNFDTSGLKIGEALRSALNPWHKPTEIKATGRITKTPEEV